MIWDMNVASNILCNSLKASIKSSLYWNNYCSLFVPFSDVMFQRVLEEKVKIEVVTGSLIPVSKTASELDVSWTVSRPIVKKLRQNCFRRLLSLFKNSKILYQILLIQRSGCLKLLRSMVGKTLRSLVLVSLVWLGIIWHTRRERKR